MFRLLTYTLYIFPLSITPSFHVTRYSLVLYRTKLVGPFGNPFRIFSCRNYLLNEVTLFSPVRGNPFNLTPKLEDVLSWNEFPLTP